MPSEPDALPPLPTVDTIRRRLDLIFPDGTPNRANATGERAARTAFVLLYLGAVEGFGRWARPDQVTKMSDRQAAKATVQDRIAWAVASLGRQGGPARGRWYQANSREGIRDDTLRYAWQPLGAVLERPGLPTTSSRPRWALTRGFAALLTWGTEGSTEPADLPERERSDKFVGAIDNWRSAHLTREARSRLELLRRLGGEAGAIAVTFPDGSVRRLAPGDSSRILKSFVEDFATRFLARPAVVWLSESREHVSVRDDDLARRIGLDISDAGILPDLILADLGGEPLVLVFCEVVASDGPMNEPRKQDVLRLATRAQYQAGNVLLVTAFLDRDAPAYRRNIGAVAWGTLSWCASEPDNVSVHLDLTHTKASLGEVMRLTSRGPSRD